jgi:hypothetical protein
MGAATRLPHLIQPAHEISAIGTNMNHPTYATMRRLTMTAHYKNYRFVPRLPLFIDRSLSGCCAFRRSITYPR